ncbi:hypothetical protein BDK88_4261 [Natrinema hispanicum]|uniref:Uncharacterized protein n=1 Tax=Natrinema hispanicum TaxID=392421 RepID=A0A482Y707_9EURY|nr:hypothetical protein BDK88_4261 [Natrinema hispanicum]
MYFLNQLYQKVLLQMDIQYINTNKNSTMKVRCV